MGNQNCDPASRGEAHNEITLQEPCQNGSGSILSTVLWDWDGTSTWPNCDGPVVSIHTKNTGNQTAWALLPQKKKAPLWVQIDPGTDVTITAAGQLNNLGLSKYTDVGGVGFVFTQPS